MLFTRIQFSKNGRHSPVSLELKAQREKQKTNLSIDLSNLNSRLVEVNGIEPMTSCVQSRRSPN